MRVFPQLDLTTRREWRTWLRRHHGGEAGVWLVFHKRHTGRATIDYEDAVEEALCFGWIDSLVRRLDEVRYVRLFTPRKPGSQWSASNRRRYRSLETRGLLAPAGMRRRPTARSASSAQPPRRRGRIPEYITRAFRARPAAWQTFKRLAPSYQRRYVDWIDAAKRPETRTRRLSETTALLEEGRKLGLK